MWIVWLGLSVILTLLSVGTIFSLSLTRRHTPDETRSPAEYGLAFEDVEFPARDGVTLRGWWIPASPAPEPLARVAGEGNQARAVIFLHGHGGSMDPDVQYVPAFHAARINVLMFDFRAHGRSDGHVSTVGYLERQDALGAVDYVRGRGIERMGLFGFSMGGSVAMLTAPICPDVRAVISDGGPARLRTSLAVWAQEHGVPRPLGAVLAWLTLAVTSLRLGANQFRYEPIRWVSKIAPRPILLIQGERDPYVPAEDFRALVAAANEPKQVWRVPQAGHRMVDQLYPDEYRRRVVTFFKEHL
jgi:pimeloyl-ACP methyl ester carboxylesterase